MFGNKKQTSGNGSNSKGPAWKSQEGLYTALDNLQTNVFVADKDLNLVFANKFAKHTLTKIQTSVFEAFKIKLDEILGASIHRFHRDPAAVERILKNPSLLPHDATFSFSGTTLATRINAAYDSSNNVLAYVVTWEDVTEQLKNERETQRMSSMIEQATVNIMYADIDFNITYINPRSYDTLKTIEQYLPCKVDDIVGQSIDIFHKDPSHQRRILSDVNNLPTKSVIQVGPEFLDLSVSAVVTDSGDHVGSMVTWDVITQKLITDREMSRVNNMMEQAPVNIMFADKDFNITYLNPSSSKTLKTVEQYLPCKVDDIVGQSIDIFHKNPAHQRNILSNPSNLPIQSNIQVGPETLDLLVSGISDEEGNYLGAMVTWDVITDKLKLETAMQRVNNMMEQAPFNIMFADRDFNIIYVNPSSAKTLKTVEQYLPCKVEDIVGQSVDIFHKNPAHQRKLLSEPDKYLPISTHIQVGPETLDLLVSPISDANGNYMGAMVTWDVITQKLKAETEMARTNNMMQSAPFNIMFADKDFNITYINPSSAKTLKTIEQYLPCRVDDIVGQSVDIFHKNPAHQRNILSNPANLPVQSNIQVGPETLDLLVSAINDNSGNYLGAMVSWEVITQKLENERKIEEANKREREQAAELKTKVDNMLSAVRLAAQGDLTQKISVAGDDAIGQMGQGLQGFFEDLGSSMMAISENANQLGNSSTTLSQTSEQMGANAEETSSQANLVAAAAEEVSANVNTVATGIEEMGASISEIASNANEAARVANEAVTTANKTNATINELGERSTEIGLVVKLISSIAEQTNLLALNATIEAARAGEAGKGFAVVANEVKELAKETAKATEDISNKIEGIQSSTNEAVVAIEEIGRIIANVNDISNTIASAVEEQTATTSEISRSVAEAAKGSSEIAENISGVAGAAQSTSQGAAQTLGAAENLSAIAAELSSLVGRFKI